MRVLRNTSALPEVSFYVDGDLQDADGDVTVTITRADGTALATDAATTNASTGVYQYVLTPQADLDELELVWTGNFDGVEQSVTTEAEIVGRHLFTEAQARAWDNAALGNTATYTDSGIADARDRITDLLELHTGVSWIPRYGQATLDGEGLGEAWLPHLHVNRILSVTVAGTAWTQPEIDALHTYASGGVVREYTGWPAGFRNVVVEYEHGYERAVDGVDRIALLWLRNTLVPSNFDDRALSMTDASGETYRLSIPSVQYPSGLPEVDAWMRAHDMRVPLV